MRMQMWMTMVLAAGMLGACQSVAATQQAQVALEKLDDRVRVTIDGELFTDYIFEGFRKPILYPVIGPHGIGMTRNFPMQRVEGEANDHPHQKSMWFTHGDVNGIDFWDERQGTGTTVHEELVEIKSEGSRGQLTARNQWVGPDGNVVLTDTRTIGFEAVPGGRIIDFTITLHASRDKVTFADTKEGTMGFRTHPNLRLRNDPRRGVHEVNGQAVNSEGDQGANVWGKRATWVSYFGEIDGKQVGVAIFDHPSNPRHPTYWHARDYGLIAVNPFGIHDFDSTQPAGAGELVLEPGQSVTFRYRFLLHEGDTASGQVAQRYRAFAEME